MHACRIIFDVSSHLVALFFSVFHILYHIETERFLFVFLCVFECILLLVCVCVFFFGAHNYFCFDRRWSCLFNTIFFWLFFFVLFRSVPIDCRFALPVCEKNALIDRVFSEQRKTISSSLLPSHDNPYMCFADVFLRFHKKHWELNIIKPCKILP